jgi:5'-methylthioadenosine phosphorylase
MTDPGGPATAGAQVGVIGGSGLYSYLDDVVRVAVETPYGPPSAPLAVGAIGDWRVAFLPRHGEHHEVPPHRVNYRANLWALRELGVRRIVGPCAVGSLRPDVHPGDMVVLDQLVDRTSGRSDTYIEGPVVDHVSFADPYCPELSGLLADVAEAGGHPVHRGGTVVVVQGPRFSTRAESRWYRQAGWDVVNMTQYPEAYLARELGLCYAGLASVTDYDTGVEGDVSVPAVTHQSVLAVLAAGADATRAVLSALIPRLPATAGCSCASGGAASLRVS